MEGTSFTGEWPSHLNPEARTVRMRGRRRSLGRIPTLRTERLYLSPLSIDDAEAVYRYASKSGVARYMSWPVHTSIEDSISFLKSVAQAPESQYDWGLRLDPAQDIIGALQFSFRSEAEAEIHYVLDEPYWGRGIMSEACRRILDWAFSRFSNLDKIVSAAVAANRASTRVMEKLAMQSAGSYEEFWPKDGVTHRMLVFEISRSRWREAAAANEAS
jgi:ribosomal-protein-alanine N-acetyltransferase